jgi:hypothetical protein
MMAKKLTLNVDEEIIAFAHAFSQKNGTTISALFERYLTRLKGEADTAELKLHPKTRALLGAFKDAPIPDKKILRRTFHEKSIGGH